MLLPVADGVVTDRNGGDQHAVDRPGHVAAELLDDHLVPLKRGRADQRHAGLLREIAAFAPAAP